jgi:glycosyltransferase involved in cell wall biosynthesis
MKIAHVSTFPHMKCGIAFYASDLIDALPSMEHIKYSLHYGTNTTPDVAGHANVSRPSKMRDLARQVSRSNCDVVCLQHEFGIWGGPDGEHIFGFLKELTKPVVTTLHTTFESREISTVRSSILAYLVERSAVTVVLTSRSRDALCENLGSKRDAITVIPHGVPAIPFSPPPPNWTSLTEDRTCRLCSVGFFRPGKGIETVLYALRSLKNSGIPFDYVVAGEPQRQFAEQERYLSDVIELVSELELSDCVRIDARFLTRVEQIEVIQTSHAGVFAYQDPDQASSGTIPLVMASGRPVICTPFEFALAKKQDVGGVTLARGFDSAAMAEALARFIASGSDLEDSRRLHERAGEWAWQTVGSSYAAAFAEACAY